MKNLEVNAYTTGLFIPSARYRVRQLIPYLGQCSVSVNEVPSINGAYPPKGLYNRIKWGKNILVENFKKINNQPQCDISWLQKPLIAKHYTFEKYLRKPLLFDVDDAIFVGSEGFARKIALQADKVICGNSFLANFFEKYNKNIEIVPTAIDLSKFSELRIDNNYNEDCIILWTGSSSGYKFLYKIERPLEFILSKYKNVKLRIVSNERPNFKIINPNQIEFIKWSEEVEFKSIRSSNIGIMPIDNDDLSKGKCSFKMLSYMAAGLPVVVSPYGMNKEVLELGEIGYAAVSYEDWVSALESLINSNKKRDFFGRQGVEIIKTTFDVSVVAKQMSNIFHSFD